MPLSILSELLKCTAFSSLFGAWLGLFFAENGELSLTEQVFYYAQHFLVAFVAPLVLIKGGRYGVGEWKAWWVGFVGFSWYMRWVLTPVSGFTWANLNHTLCGVENDPWREGFGMGKYYYFWSDFYLLFTSFLTQSILRLISLPIQPTPSPF